MWPMLLAGAVKAGTQIYSGFKKNQAAEANAALIEEQAEFKKKQAFDQATQISVQGEAFIGQQKSAFATSGVKTTTGSPLAVMKESQKSIQRDISRTREIGENALTLGLNQAQQVRQEGKDAFTSSFLGAGTTLLTSAVSAGAFDKFKNPLGKWDPGKSSIYEAKRLRGVY